MKCGLRYWEGGCGWIGIGYAYAESKKGVVADGKYLKTTETDVLGRIVLRGSKQEES